MRQKVESLRQPPGLFAYTGHTAVQRRECRLVSERSPQFLPGDHAPEHPRIKLLLRPFRTVDEQPEGPAEIQPGANERVQLHEERLFIPVGDFLLKDFHFPL